MFNQLNLSEWILNALEAKSFVVPTEIQQTCIPLIAEGKDIVGRSKTGSGKTFAFGLPAIDKVDTQLKSIQILVVCPTRELALQVTDELRKITEFKEGCGIVPIYGGADIERQIRALKGGKIAVGTPGRLMDHMRRGTLKLHNLKMAVLDEADEMLNMGFRDDIESILKATPKSRQTVMFSATMPTAIKAITREYMIEPQYVEIGELNSTIDKIDQSYIRVSRTGKKAALIELFEKLSPERSIVFCNTKRMVDDIKGLLSGKGIDCLALHGDMRQSERKRVMESIKSHKVSTLVATDVAARGIDIEDVAYIFNFDLPNDVEYYIHRIGRTARAGKSGKAITLINTKEQLVQLTQFRDVTKSVLTEHYISESLSVFDDISSSSESASFGGRRRIQRNSPNVANQRNYEPRPRQNDGYKPAEKRTPEKNAEPYLKSARPYKKSDEPYKKSNDAYKKNSNNYKKPYEKKAEAGAVERPRNEVKPDAPLKSYVPSDKKPAKVFGKKPVGGSAESSTSLPKTDKARGGVNKKNPYVAKAKKYAQELIGGEALPLRKKVEAASYFKNRKQNKETE